MKYAVNSLDIFMKQGYSLSIEIKSDDREMLMENGFRKLLADVKQYHVHLALARELQPERQRVRTSGLPVIEEQFCLKLAERISDRYQKKWYRGVKLRLFDKTGLFLFGGTRK